MARSGNQHSKATFHRRGGRRTQKGCCRRITCQMAGLVSYSQVTSFVTPNRVALCSSRRLAGHFLGSGLRRKVRHPWLGGPCRLTMYFAMLDWATSNPSFSSSRGCAALPKAYIVVLGEAHLRRILQSYARYYNDIRTHRSLDKDAPVSRPVQRTGSIKSHPILGGLHHHYHYIRV